MNKRLGAGLVCAGLLIVSTQALAWGDRERAALWGVIGGVMLANTANNPPPQAYVSPPVAYSPAPVYAPPTRVYEYRTTYVPAPRYVVESVQFDSGREAAAYERGRIDRHRDRHAHLEQEAYARGYQGAWGDWR